MPTEDRGSHEKRQDKKRRNINQNKYQNWNNRQNTEQTATILWTSESDEERTIPQNSIPRICTWNQKDMIREDCSELRLTLQEATCRTQDRRVWVWRAIIDKRLTRAMALRGP